MLKLISKPFVLRSSRKLIRDCSTSCVNKVNNIREVFGNVHSIETFSAIDGPGIRMMIFLQGCHLRCKFCSNPDTWKINKDTHISSKSIAERIRRIYPYMRKDMSGITCSGGEPLLQSDFVSALFQEAKAMNLTTCLDTAGQANQRNQMTVLPHTDLVLFCIKHTNRKKYKQLTGVSPDLALKFLDNLVRFDVPFYIRYVLIPGYTDSEQDIEELIQLTKSLGAKCKGIELLPYHTLGVQKWEALNISYPLDGLKPLGKEDVKHVYDELVKNNLDVLL
jgi:pyruvate formate lyase activating enzyme